MTPDDRAHQAYLDCVHHPESACCVDCIANAILAAIEEEREACLRDVDEVDDGLNGMWSGACQAVKALIRARGK